MTKAPQCADSNVIKIESEQISKADGSYLIASQSPPKKLIFACKGILCFCYSASPLQLSEISFFHMLQIAKLKNWKRTKNMVELI